MEAFEFSSKKLYISEHLSYVQYYLSRCSIESIKKVILNFYLPHEITDAKDTLWIAADDNLGPKQHSVSSQSRSQHEADLNDILQGIGSLDQLGIQNVFFACNNVDRMPRFAPDGINLFRLAERLSVVERELAFVIKDVTGIKKCLG